MALSFGWILNRNIIFEYHYPPDAHMHRGDFVVNWRLLFASSRQS